jgi:hypothetical protein
VHKAVTSTSTTRRLQNDEDGPDGLGDEGHGDASHGGIEFEQNDEIEKTRNYKKISEDLAVYEEEYSKCVKDIPDEEYTQEKVDECVGRNFIKVVLDIKYVTLKVMARLDTKVRKTFIKECYELAGVVEEFSEGCDVLERDVIDMLWNGLEFVELVEINKEKYLFEYGKIPNDTFRNLFAELEVLSKEFFDLLDEIDSHKEIIILRLKTLIDDRTKVIREQEEAGEEIVGHAGVHHTVEITETLQTESSDDSRRKLREKAATSASHSVPKVTANPKAQANVPKETQAQAQARKTQVEDKLRRNELFRKQMVNKLSDAMVKQAKMPFKNVHTGHYSKPSN